LVDEYQRTTAPDIYALGDVSSPYQLKHVANHEAKIVAHNLLHPDAPRRADHRFVPSAVFTAPQIATVGLTEEECRERGVRYVFSGAGLRLGGLRLGDGGPPMVLQAAGRPDHRASCSART